MTFKDCAVGAFVATMAAALPIVLTATGQPHAVVGTGLVNEDGVVFRTTVNAAQDAQGQPSGTVVLSLDLRAFGLGLTNVVSRVTCLHVVGNEAWIGAEAVHSTNPDIIPAGTATITYVRDGGQGGPDIMHGEPSDPAVSCTSEPALPETVLVSGQYQIR